MDKEIKVVLDWFLYNGMVANPEKFQAIFLGVGDQIIKIDIGSVSISSSSEVKLLGVTIDRQLSFLPHIRNICGKALIKIRALVRIRSYLSQKQADLLFSSHIMAPFNYCPLIWIFCSKQASNLINRTHHKALQARFDIFNTSFEELLSLDKFNSSKIHTRNLQILVCEVFKTLNQENPEIMWNSFDFKDPNKYDLRRGRNLIVPKARTTRAVNSFDFRASMAWNHLPSKIKSAKSLSDFRSLVEKQKIYCSCINYN